jgi:putative DNA primase/helicase
VRGCLEWQQKGLSEPPAVKAATASYRAEQDALRDFLADCCVLRPSLTVTAAGLFKAYGEWGEQNGERVLGKKTFGQRLREQRA